MTRNDDDRALCVCRKSRGNRSQQTVREASPTARSHHDQVNFLGHIDEDPRGISGLNNPMHVRRTDFTRKIDALLNDLGRTLLKSSVIKNRITPIKGCCRLGRNCVGANNVKAAVTYL